MMPARIIRTRTGILVKATARDFPSLAALEPFLELRPVGLAGDAAGRLERIEVQGRAA